MTGPDDRTGTIRKILARAAALLRAPFGGRGERPRDVARDRAMIRRALSGKLSARILKDIGGGEE